MMLYVAPLLLAFPLVQGIHLRDTVYVGPSPAWATPSEIANEDDRFVFSWPDPTNHRRVVVTWADGRALQWTVPLPVELAPLGSFMENDHVTTLVDDHWIVGWNDARNHAGNPEGTPQFDPFLRSMAVPSGQISAEVALPAFGNPALTENFVHAVASAKVNGQRHVHALLSARAWLPVASYQLRLASSHDGGASFPYVLDLDLNSYAAAPASIMCDGSIVHAAVGAKHFRSVDGGVTLDASAAPSFPGAGVGKVTDVALHRSGGALTAAWVREEWDSTFSELECSVEVSLSRDGGTTFGPPTVLQSEDAGLRRLHLHRALTMPRAGTAVVAWTAELISPTRNDVYSAVHDGQGWTTTDLAGVTLSNYRWTGLVADPENRERLAASWVSGSLDSFPNNLKSSLRVSRDGGRSWDPLQAAATTGSIARRIAYSSKYQNLAVMSHTGTAWLGGGCLFQSIEPSGFVAGPTHMGAEFHGFDDGSPTAWMLAALTPGPLPLVDGRDVGLTGDVLLSDTLNWAVTGLFAAPLNGSGSGQLTPVLLGLPPGFAVSIVGLAIDLTTFEIGDISDAVSLTAR